MHDAPLCSIVIPTRARAPLLERALASLSDQRGGSFEVIVVCDGDDADTRLLAANFKAPFPIQWIFLSQRSGQAAARNLGAKAARHEILLFMDDDTVACSTWVLQHCCHHVSAETSVRLAVCGRTVDVYSGPPASHIERFLRDQRREEWGRVEASWRQAQGSDGFWRSFGVNCSIRRSTFLGLGGFDAGLDFVAEDMELGLRMTLADITFAFEPAARLDHHDTKLLREYIPRCWQAGALADLYRVAVKKQSNAQTAGLAMVESPSLLRRARVRLSWTAPTFTTRLANLFGAIADVTGSRSCFRIWASLGMQAAYWGAVRKRGYTIASVRLLVADARRSTILGSQPAATA